MRPPSTKGRAAVVGVALWCLGTNYAWCGVAGDAARGDAARAWEPRRFLALALQGQLRDQASLWLGWSLRAYS